MDEALAVRWIGSRGRRKNPVTYGANLDLFFESITHAHSRVRLRLCPNTPLSARAMGGPRRPDVNPCLLIEPPTPGVAVRVHPSPPSHGRSSAEDLSRRIHPASGYALIAKYFQGAAVADRRDRRIANPPQVSNLPHKPYPRPGAGPVDSRSTNSGSITISRSVTGGPSPFGSRQSQTMWPMRSRGMCTVVSAG